MSWIALVLLGFALLIGIAVLLVFRRVFLDMRTERRLGLNAEYFARAKRSEGRTGESLAGAHDLTCTLAFGVTYLFADGSPEEKLFTATAVLVVANALVFVVSRNFQQNMLLVPWLSRLTIIVLGGVALWLEHETLIKMNRTVYFGLLAAWSVGSLLAGDPRLQRFGSRDHLQDITHQGWRLATLFSAIACALLALVNELIWRNYSTGFWVAFQLWGWVLAEILVAPLAFLLLRRHGYVGQSTSRCTQVD